MKVLKAAQSSIADVQHLSHAHFRCRTPSAKRAIATNDIGVFATMSCEFTAGPGAPITSETRSIVQ